MITKSKTAFYTGIWIKEKRKAKHMTQLELSQKCGMSRAWVSDLERGKTSILFEDMIKLCDVLEVSTDEAYKYVMRCLENE